MCQDSTSSPSLFRCSFSGRNVCVFVSEYELWPCLHANKQLPDGLPGVFEESGNRWNINYSAETLVQYGVGREYAAIIGDGCKGVREKLVQ